MCKYCDMTEVDIKNSSDYYIHKPFNLIDDYSQKVLVPNGNNPIMYLREYKKDIWSLICEFADDKGTVVEMKINNCPKCGRKLIN